MLDKKYNHLAVEEGKYEEWLSNNYFKSDAKSDKKPYCIVIPPPNVTGILHLGHAWDTALQDILIRYKRMQGFDALWVPGMDHAGIATQAKVDKRLRDMGIDPRSMSREDWLEQAWSWKNEYAHTIHEQWAKLGLSLDYSKERFTLDKGLNDAVNYVFVTLYNKGLIYRGTRMINWDPVQMTALSNEEVVYKEDKGAFYHIKYYISGTDRYLDVATTRPETLFGDTAVAVNPEDDRYKDIIGKNVILPIVGKEIPVIADQHADPEFGTGVVKITPAHDPNDYEVGLRHDLEQVVVMNLDATMNENAPGYEGMTREECREKLVEDLKNADLLISVEEIVHNVGHSERSDAVVEPTLSKQWFVKMRPLADRVLENQKNKKTKVNFVPERYEKTMNHWMEITYDWCISRQLWWGHRIPAWYCGEEVYVGLQPPEGDDWVQDEDVLDTWFSSALWPFSTLGWPEDTEMFKRYYPNNVLVTAYDIIPFWVNRMTFQGLEFTNQRPFKDCLIHGLVRDKNGVKMSKSLGNGVNPMEVIKEYGADSLRFYLTTSTAPGTDLRYDEEKVKSTWNFVNKLWNASRYVLMNINDLTEEKITFNNLSKADKWILTAKNRLIKETIKNMDSYDFHYVGSNLYQFIWEDFCDNYIELSKASMNDTTKTVLLDVLTTILKLLHPFMPYVTEEIFQKLPIKESESIMISSYPKFNKKQVFDEDFDDVVKAIHDITEIRNLKVSNGIKKDAKVDIQVSPEMRSIYCSQLKISDEYIIANADDVNKLQSVSYQSSLVQITYYFENEINKEQIEEEVNKLKASIARREKLLSNENYVNKAPKNIVDLDRNKLAEEKEKLKALEIQL